LGSAAASAVERKLTLGAAAEAAMELPISGPNVNLVCPHYQEGLRRMKQPEREILPLAAQ
jgi:hypothetical protein